MDEKLLLELKAIQTGLETKSATEIKSALDAFEVKASKATDEVKTSFATQLKSVTDAMEVKFLADIKAVQDHADKLDIKLQKKDVQTKGNATFNDQLAAAMLEKSAQIADFANKKSQRVDLELKAVGDFSTGNVAGGNRYGQVFAPEIIFNPDRKLHLDQIIPGGTIGEGNSFTFMREVGNGEGSIAAVAEGALKPQFDLDLEEATVQIETIAGWIRVTRKAMANIPGFISYLQRKLPELFRKVLDNQILYGTGVTPNIKGFLVAGNFTASNVPVSTPLIEKIILDVARLEDAFERNADAILLRPAAYYGFFLNKAVGSGEYDLPQGVNIVNGRLSFLGIPAFPTTALSGTDYVVMDSEGVQLLTQESMRIEFFEQDGTNVRENKVTVRIEGNYALPVYGSTYVIKGTTATA